jgi:phosphoglycolate phosphatase
MAEMGSFEGWTVAFDLDGTLVDTAPDLLGALNHVLADAGLAPVDLPTVATLIGNGARAMMERGFGVHGVTLPAPDMDAAFDRFIAYYIENIAVGSRPFDGCIPALDALLDAGATLCVCTNKRQDLSERLIGELGLTSRFAAILGADRATNRKPHQDHVFEAVRAAGGVPARALFVGDSRTDERAARNAGLPFLFVTFGYEAETVENLAPDAVIGHYSELLPALSVLRDQAVASLRGR